MNCRICWQLFAEVQYNAVYVLQSEQSLHCRFKKWLQLLVINSRTYDSNDESSIWRTSPTIHQQVFRLWGTFTSKQLGN